MIKPALHGAQDLRGGMEIKLQNKKRDKGTHAAGAHRCSEVKVLAPRLFCQV